MAIPQAAVTVLIATLALAACGGNDGTTPSTDHPPLAPNTTEPKWVVQQTPPSDVAMVYVHGIFGDAVGTWTHADGTTFFSLVDRAPNAANKTDMLAFGFPSFMFKTGSFDIVEAASRLDLHLRDQGVLKYRRIVFVAHSMGGLVVLQELLTNTEVRDKVPVVVLLATPQEGADITRIGQLVSNNAALPQMSTDDGNTLIRTMNNQWNSIPAERRPHVRCAYETLDTYRTRVVRWASATRFCEGQPTPIAANHIDIVKPNASSLDAVRVVTSAMTDYVFDRKLVTPDFRVQGNTAVLDLATALGQQRARLENSGTASLYYTLAEPSDPALYMWPETLDNRLDGKSSAQIRLALGIGARANEYQFVLRSDAAPDLRVTVRVPDLARVRSEQMQLVQDVGTGIQRLLADPQSGQRLRSLGANDGEASTLMVEAARAAVARANPDLPVSAQWVLAAEALNATNWPGLAATALRQAEKTSPAVARTRGVQRLAAFTAA
jgi:pimeloyl-ACP methyl ester carboxylesterase